MNVPKKVLEVVQDHTTVGKADLHKCIDACGIDSLGRMELLHDLEEEFGVTLDPDKVFEAPTPGELIDHVQEKLRDE